MTNYLYNGTELPELPESKYPHAYIEKAFSISDVLFVSKPLFMDNGLTSQGEQVTYEKYNYEDNAWVYAGEYTEVVDRGFGLKWVNTDVYTPDGTLYLAASEPIPVGTAPALDPLSLFPGWKAGNWVARQRGKKVERPEEETSETVVIEWDGDNTDLEYLEAGTTPYWYYAPMYKVSDQTPTLEQLQNAKMVLGKTDDATVSENYLMTESPGFTIADINDAGYLLVIGLAMTSTNYMSYVVVIRNEEFAEYLGVSTGTYFLRIEGGYYTMKLEYPVTVE